MILTNVKRKQQFGYYIIVKNDQCYVRVIITLSLEQSNKHRKFNSETTNVNGRLHNSWLTFFSNDVMLPHGKILSRTKAIREGNSCENGKLIIFFTLQSNLGNAGKVIR